MARRSVLEILFRSLWDGSGAKKAKEDTDSLGHSLKRNVVDLVGGYSLGAAATAFASDSLKSFASFEQGMREVFTLLPGISKKAMGEMTEDARQAAVQMGRLPDEVVPALYQSLSAGVPPGNVFDFLEVANQAARGGVTSLETAVDGLTSVVNAYGADIINVERASDLMFTAVRLGKTNFEELSRSLFNVIPTAAATGVEFGNVTAALAAMTAQGTPTSVATTQMRQLLVELSKEGGKASETFERISGQSFREFIAQGGNLNEALQMMSEAAASTGVGVNDLFSSVEAGNAALALTGRGAETFTNNLAEMENSAGATATAAETMAGTTQESLDRMTAAYKAFAVSSGESLVQLAQNIGLVHAAIASLEFLAGTQHAEGVDAVTNSLDQLIESSIPVEEKLERIDTALENMSWKARAFTQADEQLMQGKREIIDGILAGAEDVDVALQRLSEVGINVSKSANFIARYQEARAQAVQDAAEGHRLYAEAMALSRQATEQGLEPTRQYNEELENTGVAINNTVEAEEALASVTDFIKERMAERQAVIANENRLFQQTESLYRDLANAQAELAGIESGGLSGTYADDARAAEEAQAKIEEANNAIVGSYQTMAFEAVLAHSGVSESTLALGVSLGVLTQAEADARFEMTQRTSVLEELAMSTTFLNDSYLDQAEATQLVALGYANTAEEAINLADKISGSLSQSLLESTSLTEGQINLLDRLNGTVVTSTVRVTIDEVGRGVTGGAIYETGGTTAQGGGSSVGQPANITNNTYNIRSSDVRSALEEIG